MLQHRIQRLQLPLRLLPGQIDAVQSGGDPNDHMRQEHHAQGRQQCQGEAVVVEPLGLSEQQQHAGRKHHNRDRGQHASGNGSPGRVTDQHTDEAGQRLCRHDAQTEQHERSDGVDRHRGVGTHGAQGPHIEHITDQCDQCRQQGDQREGLREPWPYAQKQQAHPRRYGTHRSGRSHAPGMIGEIRGRVIGH
ncbi:hypothetical protein FQZ97_763000 [compost metagenome]